MARNSETAVGSQCRFGDTPIEVRIIYEPRAGQPSVELTVGQTVVRIEPDQAQELGEMLVRAAVFSMADGFVFEFAHSELGVDDLAAALMLRKFRAWRLSRGQDAGNGHIPNDECHAPGEVLAPSPASIAQAMKP
jgi:hypothetical protein